MSASAEKMELIFEPDSITAEWAASRLMDILGLTGSQVRLYNELMNSQRVIEKITEESRSSFSIEGPSALVHFSTIKAYRQQLLSVTLAQSHEITFWERIIHPFLECDGFVQACLLNCDYTFWQNASDPLQYQAASRSFDNLAMVPNGLPPPLEKFVVDISRNPGRRLIKVGYVEMVGHAMWFGRRFWNHFEAHVRQRLLTSAPFHVTELPHEVVRVIASEKPFTDETTQVVQERLRALLFG